MAIGDRRWTFLLQPTGKVDVLARVERVADDAFVFDIDAGYGDELVARLNRFKIRVKVDVEALPWRVLCVVGGRDIVGPDPEPPAGLREGTRGRARGGPRRRRLAGDGRRDRAGRDDPRRDRRRGRRRRLPQGLLPRPGAGRADGLPRRHRTALAARARRRRRRAARRSDRARRPARSACSPRWPAASASATSSAVSTSAGVPTH